MKIDEINIHDKIAGCREQYNNVIKPLIQEQECQIAAFELENIIYLMNMNAIKIIGQIHCGMSYMASMKLLHDKLKEENPNKNIFLYVEIFEAYQAQTKLPTKKSLDANSC